MQVLSLLYLLRLGPLYLNNAYIFVNDSVVSFCMIIFCNAVSFVVLMMMMMQLVAENRLRARVVC